MGKHFISGILTSAASRRTANLRNQLTTEQLMAPNGTLRARRVLEILKWQAVTTLELNQLLSTVDGRKALSEARKMAAEQGVTIQSEWIKTKSDKRIKRHFVSDADKRKLGR